MKIEQHKTLISNLPVRGQCFTTKRTTWKKAEDEIEWLKNLNDKLFDGEKTMTISRQDIFDTQKPREVIIKTIYWGYPSGMRGNHFINILNHIDTIEKAILCLTQNTNPTEKDFNQLAAKLKNVKGLGLSTYSKILYFFNISFDGNPCLILDQRLMDLFKSNCYSELGNLSEIRYPKAEKKYLKFLQLIKDVANKVGTKEENIESFLFTFGKNIKY